MILTVQTSSSTGSVILLKGTWLALFWIIQQFNIHRTVVVDVHHKPFQPHHWDRSDPVLDGGIAGAREAGIEETGAVGGHVFVHTAGEDSRHHDRVAELPVHGAAVVENSLLDMHLQLPLNQLGILPLNEEDRLKCKESVNQFLCFHI